MATLVVDASVIVKWLLADPIREPDTERATALMRSIAEGAHDVLQPPHWLAEVAAVLARRSPRTAAEDVLRLHAMELPVADVAGVWERACRVAADTDSHVFDTLYHAVALEHTGATCITADGRYRAKAAHLGRLIDLDSARRRLRLS